MVETRDLRDSAAEQTFSDGDLIDRFAATHKAGDFDFIVRRHWAMVLGTCRRHLPNHHDAEDAAQATFLALSRRPESARTNLAGWLHCAARLASLHLARTHRRRNAHERACKVGDRAVPEPVVSGQSLELREELDAALDRLPVSLREAVILQYLEGLDPVPAARIAGCSAVAFRKRTMRGLRQLRHFLHRRGVAVSGSALAGLLGDVGTAAASAAPTPSGITAPGASPSTAVAEAADSVSWSFRVAKVKALATSLGLFAVAVALAAIAALALGRHAHQPAPQLSPPPQSTPEMTDRRQQLERDIAVVLPRPDEERWLQIPWRVDFAAARVEAARVKKPVFVWAAHGSPLGGTDPFGQFNRTVVFSNPDVIEAVRRDFVPVAVNLDYFAPTDPALLPNTESSRFFKAMAKGFGRGPYFRTRQGYYAFDAAGDFSAAQPHDGFERSDLRRMKTFLADAQKNAAGRTFRPPPLTETTLGPEVPVPDRASVVRVFSRIVDPVEDPDNGPRTSRDYAWVLQQECAAIVRDLGSASEGELPTALAARLVRFHFVDLVRGSPHRWATPDVRRQSFRVRLTHDTEEVVTAWVEGTYRVVAVEQNGKSSRAFDADPFAPPSGSRGIDGHLAGVIEIDKLTATLRHASLFSSATLWDAKPRPPTGTRTVTINYAIVTDPTDTAGRMIAPRALVYFRGLNDNSYLKPE